MCLMFAIIDSLFESRENKSCQKVKGFFGFPGVIVPLRKNNYQTQFFNNHHVLAAVSRCKEHIFL